MSRPKRKRGVPLYVWVSEAEHDIIRQRMEEAGTQNMSAYIRKMAANGYIVRLDLPELGECSKLLRSASNNLNQIARRANETRSVYESDIKDLQEHYNLLWEQASAILRGLAKIQE